MEIEVNISKPVTLGGLGFIKNSFGIISSKNKDVVDKYKRELSKLLNNVIKVLQEKYGKDTTMAANENKKNLGSISAPNNGMCL